MRVLEKLLLRYKKKGKGGAGTETALQIVCGKDKEMYEALRSAIFPNGPTPLLPLEECREKAAKANEAGDKHHEKIWIQLTAKHFFYLGDLDNIKQWFGRYEELTGQKLVILRGMEESPRSVKKMFSRAKKEKGDIIERAVQKGQEYYKLIGLK